MSTTDLQRLHQDEWLSALRSGEYTQTTGELGWDRFRCAIGVGCDIASIENDYEQFCTWLGVSIAMMEEIYRRNDGSNRANRVTQSFDEIADWFKVERDRCDGDLSNWRVS